MLFSVVDASAAFENRKTREARRCKMLFFFHVSARPPPSHSCDLHHPTRPSHHSSCPTQQSQVTAKLCFRDFPRMRASDTSSATRRFARSVLPPEPSLSLSLSLPPHAVDWAGPSVIYLISLFLSLSLLSLSLTLTLTRTHTRTLEKVPMLQPRRLTVVWNQCRLRKKQRQVRGTIPWTADTMASGVRLCRGGRGAFWGREVCWALASAGQARPGAGPEPDGGGPGRRIRRRRKEEEAK